MWPNTHKEHIRLIDLIENFQGGSRSQSPLFQFYKNLKNFKIYSREQKMNLVRDVNRILKVVLPEQYCSFFSENILSE
ncbi:MAG: hypothetical protein QE271_11030 [Bacteriovoracaceae bacterium]|nr:hypothetical protein [Bacteriovoracaceae bacterium]